MLLCRTHNLGLVYFMFQNKKKITVTKVLSDVVGSRRTSRVQWV